jgi:hypothetical protein
MKTKWTKGDTLPDVYNVMGMQISGKVLAYDITYGWVTATVWINDSGIAVWRNACTGNKLEAVTNWRKCPVIPGFYTKEPYSES